jgi:hypothetical protein
MQQGGWRSSSAYQLYQRQIEQTAMQFTSNVQFPVTDADEDVVFTAEKIRAANSKKAPVLLNRHLNKKKKPSSKDASAAAKSAS